MLRGNATIRNVKTINTVQKIFTVPSSESRQGAGLKGGGPPDYGSSDFTSRRRPGSAHNTNIASATSTPRMKYERK